MAQKSQRPKDPWQIEPLVSFPNFNAFVTVNRKEIDIVAYWSKLPKDEKTITGFLTEMFLEVDISPGEEDDEVEIIGWMTSEFGHKLRAELKNRVIPEFARWFPYMDRGSSGVDVGVRRIYSLDFEVWIQFEIFFGREVPLSKFSEDVKGFSTELVSSKTLDELVYGVIEGVIYEEFPDTDVSVSSLFPYYEPQPREIRLISEELVLTGPTRRVYNFPFPRDVKIEIYFNTPLPEEVVQSLANSSDKRDFLLKLLMYTADNIKKVEMIPIPEGVEFESIGDLFEFLQELE